MQADFKLSPKANSLLCIGFALLALTLTYLLLVRGSPYVQNADLPQFQKEASLFSENAFYYSYFKRARFASDNAGLKQALFHDDRFTYPEKIAPVFQFNIWPEIIAGRLSIHSYESRPFNFYLYFMAIGSLLIMFVPLLFGLMDRRPWYTILLIYILLLNNIFFLSRFGHSPFQREAFGVPFFFLCIAAFFSYLSSGKKNSYNILIIGTVLHGLVWQFSIISHLLMNLLLVGAYYVNDDEIKVRARNLLYAQLFTWLGICGLMGFNRFYIFSWNLSLLLCFVIVEKTKKEYLWALVATMPLIFGNSFGHVIEIFNSIFLNKDTFTSLLYSLSDAFRPLRTDQYRELFTTGMIVAMFFVLLNYKNFPKHLRLLLFIPLAFTLPALFIMRLTALAVLTWTAYILISVEFLPRKMLMALMGTMLLFFGFQDHSFKYEELPEPPFYSELAEYVRNRIPVRSVIGCDFTLSANLALNTNLKFILHPQYESEDSRRRNETFSRIYAYFNEQTIYNYLKPFELDYVIIDGRRCLDSDFARRVVRALHVNHERESMIKFCDLPPNRFKEFTYVTDIGFYRILKFKK